jgi:hypothetical protein
MRATTKIAEQLAGKFPNFELYNLGLRFREQKTLADALEKENPHLRAVLIELGHDGRSAIERLALKILKSIADDQQLGEMSHSAEPTPKNSHLLDIRSSPVRASVGVKSLFDPKKIPAAQKSKIVDTASIFRGMSERIFYDAKFSDGRAANIVKCRELYPYDRESRANAKASYLLWQCGGDEKMKQNPALGDLELPYVFTSEEMERAEAFAKANSHGC